MAGNEIEIVLQAVDKTKEAFRSIEIESQGLLSKLRANWLEFTAAGAAIFGMIRSIQSFVDEAAEAEQVENRLRFALENLGYSWDAARISVDKFASSIQEATRYSDEDARRVLTDMLLYTRDFSKALDASRLAMDMSARTGQDLSSSARMIGMALSGNVEMLGRYIPELRNLEDRLGASASQAEKAEYALKILNEKFSGTARADMESYAGKVKAFQNSWNDLKETLGSYLLPVLKECFDWLKKVIDLMNSWSAQFKASDVLEQLKKDLAVAERTIRIYKDYIASAEKGLPGFRLGPEAMEDAKAALKKQEEWAKYLEQQIKSIESDARARIAAQTKKDVFPPGDKTAAIKVEMDYAKRMLEYAQFIRDMKLEEEMRARILDIRIKEINASKELTKTQKEDLIAAEKRTYAEQKVLRDAQKEIASITQLHERIQAIKEEDELRGRLALIDQEARERGWGKERDIVEQIRMEIEKWQAAEEELGRIAIVNQEARERGWQREKEALEDLRQALLSTFSEDNWMYWERVTPTMGMPTEYKEALEAYEKAQRAAEETKRAWEATLEHIAFRLGDVFTNLFTDVLTGSKNAFRKFCTDLLKLFSDTVQKMIMNWIIFGNVVGTKGSGGLLGLLLPGSTPAVAGGGGGGGAGAYPWFGDWGPGLPVGSLAPESKGDTYIYISAVDTQSIEDALEKGQGKIIRIVNEQQRSRW